MASIGEWYRWWMIHGGGVASMITGAIGLCAILLGVEPRVVVLMTAPIAVAWFGSWILFFMGVAVVDAVAKAP